VTATLRQGAKLMRPRPPISRAIAGRSFAGRAPDEPVQRVTPLDGLSTSETSRRSAAAAVMIRGGQNTDQGRSSGWMPIRTPAAFATATTGSEKSNSDQSGPLFSHRAGLDVGGVMMQLAEA
jgi:hypothetical protein